MNKCIGRRTIFLENIISSIKDDETKVDLSGYSLKTMIEEAVHNESFHYAGSLTTPNCQQSVTWNVMNPKYVLSISEGQVNILPGSEAYSQPCIQNSKPSVSAVLQGSKYASKTLKKVYW